MEVARGTCHSIFVYDIAFSINLNEAEQRITSFKQRETIKHKRRAPRYFEYRPAPLRISQDGGAVDIVVYDFGAVSVIYRTPLAGEFSKLLTVSQELYENEQMLTNSRKRVDELVQLIGSALAKPNISAFVEDYLIFQIEAFDRAVTVEALA